jgi:hypothetical protein
MLKKLLIRGGLSLLGTAAVLTWWTIHPGTSNVKQEDRIPAKFGDGGNLLEISIESSSPATMSVDFNDHTKEVGSQMLAHALEKIPAGSHSWSIDVPAHIGGYIELEAVGPKTGDTLTMEIKMNGEAVDRQSESLTAPLNGNEAFFLQDFFDDYSKAKQDLRGGVSERAE